MSDEWEGGRRQGVRWRPVVAAVVAVALAGTWWLARRDQRLPVETDDVPVAGPTASPEVVVTSPRGAGERQFCPNGFPISVRDGLYYPVNFPRDGAPDRPQQCFTDAQRAEAAGYALAPAPVGTSLAGGVYLVPVEHPQPAVCRDVADVVGFAVPCPRRLPSPAYGPSCAPGRCVFGAGVVIEQRAFVLPDHWCQSCPARVVITAAHRRGTTQLVTCGPGEELRELPDEPVATEACPQGPTWIPGIGGHPHEGNPVYRWQRGPIVYAVSVEATAPVEDVRELLRAVVDGIELVPPT